MLRYHADFSSSGEVYIIKISKLMKSNPMVLKSESSIQDAARLFLENKIDGAPVVDDEGNLIGILGKTQLYQAIACGAYCDKKVKDLMIKEPLTIGPDDDTRALANLEVGRVPVVEGSKVLGMVTQSDLTRYYYAEYKGISQELETVINSTYNAIVSIDLNENIHIFNPAAEKLFGRNKEDVVGTPFINLFPTGQLHNVMMSGIPQHTQKMEFHGKHLISNRTPIIVDGKVVGAVAILQDVSDFKAIFEELQTTIELKEEMDAIIESSFDGIFVTDGEGRVLRANEAYCRITGIKLEEVLGSTMDELVDRGVYDKSVSMLVREQLKPITLTQEVRTGKTVLVTGNPIFDEENHLFRVVTNVRDVTELNTLKREVEHAQGLSLHFQEQLTKAQLQGRDDFIIRAQKSVDMLDLVLRVAKVNSTVLIQGESGVGKEVVANILHNNSLRKDKPMVRINCGAIPDNLLESELFGYEPGAFTGAQKSGKMGIFQLADQGTLFLDEIGELPLSLQVKILRAIQENEIIRVGGIRPVKVDVRIIAATNRDLWDMVLNGEFRKDLYYRLNVVMINIPPLRERREEIPALTYFFMKKLNNKYGLNKEIDEKVVDQLITYSWPGNVRELENAIERAYVTSASRVIEEVKFFQNSTEQENFGSLCFPDNLKLKDAVEQVEKTLILNSLKQCKSTRKAAVILGVSQPTVVRKAARYGITCNDCED